MVNPVHLDILKEGPHAWLEWRGYLLHLNDLHPDNVETPDLSDADLSYTDLSNIDFSCTDLSGVKFIGANLEGADFDDAKLIGANLSGVDLTGVMARYANFSQANLSGVNLTQARLRSANLSGANLSGADFTKADLTNTKLIGANLNTSKLIEVRALTADFSQSTLTGAVIDDWHIGRTTKLDSIKCDYVFCKRNFETGELTARLPATPNTFAPGEFVQLFQVLDSALETIPLTFTEGIDWKAFFASFQELHQQYPDDEISIQGIERKSSAFIVRLEVLREADKGAIETRAKQLYETQLKALEAQYEKQLRLQGTHLEDIRAILEFERQERTRLSKVVERMADDQKAPKYDMRGAQFAGGFAETVEGDQVGGTQHNYAAPEKQSLSDAALEIQRLLKQLEATNPTATEAEQKAFVTAAIPATLRQRAVGALRSGGRAAVEEVLDNPYVNVAIAVIEGWQGAE